MITQADKGRTLVIMYREDYHNKVHTFLTNNYFQTIPKNPTNLYHNQVGQPLFKYQDDARSNTHKTINNILYFYISY